MLTALLSLAVLSLPRPQVDGPARPDTADALFEASSLIYRYYGSTAPSQNRLRVPCLKIAEAACSPEPGVARAPAATSCQGVGLAECMGGDWDCWGLAMGDCLLPSERAELIAGIEALARRAGSSMWLYRQRVGLAVKDGRLDSARRIARECGSLDWFCFALRGFVKHRLHPGSGQAEFDSALALAPEPVRCYWTDPSPLRARPPSSDECAAASEARETVWWLVDPLWTREGNERKVEHFARHVMRYISWGANPRDSRNWKLWEREEKLAERALLSTTLAQTEDLSLGPRNSLRHQQSGRMQTWEAYVYGGYHFAPSRETLASPLESTSADWTVRWNEGDERMIIREEWHDLVDQTVVLRRGERLDVLAATELPPQLRSGPVVAGLALARPGDRRIFTAPAAPDTAGDVRAELVVDDGGYVASLEAVAHGAVGRVRHGVPAPRLVDGFGVSDLALVRDGPDVEEVRLLDLLLPSTTLLREAKVALYFEVYGVLDENLRVTLSAERENRSLLARVTSIFGGSGPPINLEWMESARASDTPYGPVVRRFLDLDLSGLPAGDHRLVLEVRRADGRMARASRMLRIVE